MNAGSAATATGSSRAPDRSGSTISSSGRVPVEDGRFVVRAEVPGINPDNDAEVTVAKGILTIHAERHEEHEGACHSEFRYGSVSRHVALPATADESDITASYDKGIIEVSVGLKAEDEGRRERRVPIQPVQRIRPT